MIFFFHKEHPIQHRSKSSSRLSARVIASFIAQAYRVVLQERAALVRVNSALHFRDYIKSLQKFVFTPRKRSSIIKSAFTWNNLLKNVMETTQSHPYLEPVLKSTRFPLSLTQHERLQIWPLSYQMTSPPHNPSIYGQEGWWGGEPLRVSQRCEISKLLCWGETGAAVETPWCQRHAGYSFASRLGLDALRMEERGQRWWKVMFTCALATTLGPHPPPKPPPPPPPPAGSGLAPR